jgi:hypothetical protein
MRRFITTLAMLVGIILPAKAQRIEIRKPDRNQIIRVRTALNHLTVIEVGERVTTVAAGSSAFKVEWRENKVFVQPTEPGATTNLFIWTASGRLNYELEAAGAVDDMDFAIDQPVARPAPPPPPAPTPVTAVRLPMPATQVALDNLLGGRPIRSDGSKVPRNRVTVLLRDTFEQADHEIFIRYAVRNDTREVYTLSTPQVFTLKVNGAANDLSRWLNSQVGESVVDSIENDGGTPVAAVSGTVRAARVEPGQETVGVVSFKLPAGETRVIRLVFPDDGKGRPTATLVF